MLTILKQPLYLEYHNTHPTSINYRNFLRFSLNLHLHKFQNFPKANLGATAPAITPKSFTLSAIPTILDLLSSHPLLINPIIHPIAFLMCHINTEPVKHPIKQLNPSIILHIFKTKHHR